MNCDHINKTLLIHKLYITEFKVRQSRLAYVNVNPPSFLGQLIYVLQASDVICETFVNLLPDSQNSGKGLEQMQIFQ